MRGANSGRLVEEVQERVEAGSRFKTAVAQVLSANARLLALWRMQQRK